MRTTLPLPTNPSPLPYGLPAGGKLVAIVVGVEDYQLKAKGQIPRVDFARNDATAVAEALTSIFGADQSDVQLFVDDQATLSNIGYQLKQTIGGLEEHDLFVFYYAGHGYHGAGGNRITAWVSHAHGSAETTLLLQEILAAPLQKSACTRALAFVDACGTALPSAGPPGCCVRNGPPRIEHLPWRGELPGPFPVVRTRSKVIPIEPAQAWNLDTLPVLGLDASDGPAPPSLRVCAAGHINGAAVPIDVSFQEHPGAWPDNTAFYVHDTALEHDLARSA